MHILSLFIRVTRLKMDNLRLLNIVKVPCIMRVSNVTSKYDFAVIKFHIFVLLASYVTCALPNLEPEFLPTASNVTYTRGDLAILFCAVKHLGTKFVSWRKTSDPSPLTVGTLIYAPDSRFHVSYIEYRGEWNLYIKNVSHRDAGLYECQVSTKFRDMRKYVLLNVKEPLTTTTHINLKKDVDDIIFGPVSVDVGNELYVSCNVSTEGYDQDSFDIDWFIDGIKVDERNERINITKQFSDSRVQSTLSLKHASKEDTGEYICSTTSKQMRRQNIFVLNGEKSSSNSKRGTDKTDKLKVSLKTSNGNRLTSNIYCTYPILTISFLFYTLVLR